MGAAIMMTAVSCSKKVGDASEIQMNPGDMIYYSSEKFVPYYDNSSKVFLRKVGFNGKLETVLDLSSQNAGDAVSGADHAVIVPKGVILKGSYVVQVDLEKYQAKLFAVVFGEAKVVPSIASTIIYHLLINYPNKDIGSYTESELQPIKEYIDQFIANRVSLFEINLLKINPKLLVKFFENGLQNDNTFLGLAAAVGLGFQSNGAGIFSAPPYPFGYQNVVPKIDDSRSTAPGDMYVAESDTLKVQFKAADPEQDLVFYLWNKSDVAVSTSPEVWFWTPGYFDASADPYSIKAYASDGGFVTESAWDVYVTDSNRAPTISGSCPKNLTEGQTLVCNFSVVDNDGDGITWKVINAAADFKVNKPTLNTVLYPTTVTGTTATFQWTPDNQIFDKTTFTLILSVDDGNGGFANTVQTVAMKAVDAGPEVIFSDLNATIAWRPSSYVSSGGTSAFSAPHEVDSCILSADPDTGTVSKLYGGTFIYEIYVWNPDDILGNTPLSDTATTISLSGGISGFTPFLGTYPTGKYLSSTWIKKNTVKNKWVQTTAGDPDTTKKEVPVWVLQYQWVVSDTNKTLNPTVSATDPQNAKGASITQILTAEDRAEIPCLNGTSFAGLTTSAAVGNASALGSFKDGDSADSSSMIMILRGDGAANGRRGTTNQMTVAETLPSVAPKIEDEIYLQLPFLLKNSSPQALLIMRKNVYDEENFLSYQELGKTLNVARTHLAQVNGFLRLQRPNCNYTNPLPAAVTIPLGTQFRTTVNAVVKSYNPQVTFQTTQAVTMNADDCEVSVPIKAINRTADAANPFIGVYGLGNFTKIANVNVTHGAISGFYGSVNFQNTTGAAITISAGSTVRTDEVGGKDSIVYFVPRTFSIPATSTVSKEVIRGYFGPNTHASPPKDPTANTDFTNNVAAGGYATNTGQMFINPYKAFNCVAPAGTCALLTSISGASPTCAAGACISNPAFIYANTVDVVNNDSWSPNAYLAMIFGPRIAIADFRSAYVFNFMTRAVDGAKPAANKISLLNNPPGLNLTGETWMPLPINAPDQVWANQVNVSHGAFTNALHGPITLKFKVSTEPAPLTIPAHTIFATANRQLFATMEDAIIPAGVAGSSTGVTVEVRRYYEPNYKPGMWYQKIGSVNYLRYGWALPVTSSYSNNPITLNPDVQSNLSIPANVVKDIPIEVTDNPLDANSGTRFAKDPWDRVSISSVAVTSTKPGQSLPTKSTGCVWPWKAQNAATCNLQLCRETSVESPVTCNPCTTLNSGAGIDAMVKVWREWGPHQSRLCFIRFTPDPADASYTFTLNLRFQEANVSGAYFFDKKFNVTITESNTAPRFADSAYVTSTSGVFANVNWGTAWTPGDWNTFWTTPATTPADWGTAIEGSVYQKSVYAIDDDKAGLNKTVSYTLDTIVFDRRTNTFRTAPPGMTIKSIVSTPNANGTGSKTSGMLEWKPTDEDSKTFSSNEGFIVHIKAYDNVGEDPPAQLSKDLYALIKLNNINNTPTVGDVGPAANKNIFTVVADTYFSATFVASDLDAYTPINAAFQTTLTPCMNPDGTKNINSDPDFDNQADPYPYNCHLSELYFNPMNYSKINYNGNSATTQCRSGGAVYQDLIVPKLTKIAGPIIENSVIKYQYKIEWCPQATQVGNYFIPIQLTDNADKAVNGSMAPVRAGLSGLTLNVVAPVFLISPRNASAPGGLHSMSQTSAVPVSNLSFTYPTIVKNSKGNALQYSILNSPRPCDQPNGVCISSSGVITWQPKLSDVTADPGNQASWPVITVKVRDTVTGESDQATFKILVQSPTAPLTEASPSITSYFPASANVRLLENSIQLFNVVATDSNTDDQLYYRWYIDGVLVYDDGDQFTYRPDAEAGTKNNGVHLLKVEVTDGNFVVSQSWNLKIGNNYILGSQLMDIPAKMAAVNVVDLYSDFIGHQDLVTSSIQNSHRIDRLYFTGSVLKNMSRKHVLWNLNFDEGQLVKPGDNVSWNYFEGIPWENAGAGPGQQSAHLSMSNDAGKVYLSRIPGRYGPNTMSTDAISMSLDFTSYRQGQSPPVCTPCSTELFLNSNSSNLLTAKLDTVNGFWSNGTNIYWDRAVSGPGVALPNATLDPGSWLGLVVNPATKRLYATKSNGVSIENIYVYDLNPVLNATPSAPTFVKKISLANADSANPTVASLPAGIAVATSNSAIFVFLKGTGGFAKIINETTVQYGAIGVIGPSATDPVGSGQKLIYDAANDLVFGLSRDARQVFTIDPVTGSFYVQPILSAVDSLWVSPNTGLVLMVDRTRGLVYTGQ